MQYPLGRLYDEASLVEERENGRIITDAQLIQTAVHSLMSKDARRQFSKMLKTLNVQVTPRSGLFDKEE